MAGYHTPFGGRFDPDQASDAFLPGIALARALAAVEGKDLSQEGDLPAVETPWGTLTVETRSQGQLVVQTPRAEVAAPRIMLNVAAMRLGLDREAIEATDMAIQVIDVGRPVLVVAVDDRKRLANAPGDVDLSTVPGASAEQAIIYTRTQRTPYVKIRGRVLGKGDPLTCLAAAALHIVVNNGVRATYPRTRIVGELDGHGDDHAEMTVEAEKAGHTPKIQRVFVGGEIRPAEPA